MRKRSFVVNTKIELIAYICQLLQLNILSIKFKIIAYYNNDVRPVLREGWHLTCM